VPQAIALLRDAEAQGLVAADYDLPYLEETAAALGAASSPNPEEVALFDVGLTVSLLRFLGDVHRGRVSSRSVGFDYHSADGHDLPVLLRQGLAEGDLPRVVAELEPALAQYARLKTSLKLYRGLVREVDPVPLAAAARVHAGRRAGVPLLHDGHRAARRDGRVLRGHLWEG
jgi:murein L,D-transpeptidase YcbB/YkuD